MNTAQLPPQALAQLAAVTDGALRVGPLLGIPALLRDLGQDPHPVFAAAEVDPRLFDDPENTIEFSTLGRLMSECVEHTGRPDFGLLIGRGTGLPALGLVGMLAECSPDLGTALHNIILHLHLHDRGALPRLTVGKGRAVFSYTIYQPAAEATAQIYDAAIAITNNILDTLYGPGWQPSEVLLARAKPLDAEPYRKFFRAPIRFGAQQSAVVFPAAWLAHPLPGADADLFQAIRDRIAAIESMGGGDIVVQVRRVLCNLLMGGEVSMDAVARIFAVHRRTLNRRLREHGVTLRQLIEDVRRQLARQLLRDTDLSVMAIAETLGYADASAFTRAFRRWSGTTPSGWRAARRRA
ncbi:MAG: AraC family transcriptional regulator [Chromatiaceae bacterium]